jgi:hypothetical protein
MDKLALTCFQTRHDCTSLRAAPSTRHWMDAFSEKFAYRCLPLVQANSLGWELLCKHDLAIRWNGGDRVEDLEVVNLENSSSPGMCASSWFSRGIVTFHSDYVFSLSDGYQLLVTGPLNRPKSGIAPLAGVVDTSRLPFTFTMNWMMTRPGTVIFEKDEPFALILPINVEQAAGIVPEIRDIRENPLLEKQFQEYQVSRGNFNEKIKEGGANGDWQKFYVRGTDAGGRAIAGPLRRVKARSPVSGNRLGCPRSELE